MRIDKYQLIYLSIEGFNKRLRGLENYRKQTSLDDLFKTTLNSKTLLTNKNRLRNHKN